MVRAGEVSEASPLSAYKRYARYAVLSIWSICDICFFMSKEAAYPIKKLVNLTEDQAKRISDFRFDERLPSENEAIRRLIELGLEAAKRTAS